jgi:putative colanic acid biosynthesis UDP-glucose lipid carrier transferase
MLSNSSGGLLRPQSSLVTLLQRLVDVAVIAMGMYFALFIRKLSLDVDYLLLMCLAALLFMIFAEIHWLYRLWGTEKLLGEFVSVMGVWFSVVMFLVMLGFVTKTTSEYSRVAITMWVVTVPAIMLAIRIVYWRLHPYLYADGGNTRTLVFFGSCKTAHKMAARIQDMTWMGLKVVGVFDDRPLDRIDLGGLTFEGNMQNLITRAKSGEIDVVYITLPMHAESRIVKLVNQLSDTTASVYVVPDSFVFDLYHARWSNVAGVPVVSVYESPFYGIEGWVKRAEDLMLGSVILLFILPLMLVIALGVKLTTPGSVIFKQRRYGLNGEVVEVWKFRSMTVSDDGDSVVQASKNDARVTPFGAFLRRNSLDELPQFINVLQGRMSIVGPRPHAVLHNEQYRSIIRGYMLRHKVRPGITGWAQVNGWRGETDSLEKMQGRIDCDLAYVRNWTLWLDIKIIWMTLCKFFIAKNAY